jgi:sRNA-binding protein
MPLNKRQARAQAAVAQLRERFPAIFGPADCRPLKIGIHSELLAQGLDRETVVGGLRSYCGSSAYLSSLREDAARIGLVGQPTGFVSAEEERIAAAQLAEKAVQAKNRRLLSKPPSAKPTVVVTLIPSAINQNPCPHWRNPMDMIRQG